ncbi:NADH:flavin oxidoreductase [Candidatus Bipolaricaulota bacterium]|nr:NADH:flavin oxidoreductase [Candidatus Bipolaricaulota bacterium]
MLFDGTQIGTLELKNRIVRSATAEMMADDIGVPLPQLIDTYRELARGGVGLIITGHMFVHPSGKAHPSMTGICSDDHILGLKRLADAVHAEGGAIAAQINHGGRQVRGSLVDDPIAPSAHEAPPPRASAREMTMDEIEILIDAYAQAARRAKEAGFDAVQIHAAHGYLVSQFLSPIANGRFDGWGGTFEKRTRFFRRIIAAVREQVGCDFPVFAKLGIRDESEDGLSLDDGVAIVSELRDWGLDAVEISGGLAETGTFNIVGDIGPGENEATFRPWAQAASKATELPIILVGGMRSLDVMEDVLQSGDAQLISMCRPLICEPDLPRRLQQGIQTAASCVSKNRCWPGKGEIGISCKCSGVIRKATSS